MNRIATTLLAAVVVTLLAAMPARAATTIYTGPIQFTDSDGNTHVMKDLQVDFWEDDFDFDDDLGSDTTDAAGLASVSTDQDELVDDFLEIYVQINARIPGVANVRPTLAGSIYSERNPDTGSISVPVGASVSLPALGNTFDNTDFVGTAMTILNPARFMHDYYANTHSHDWAEIPILYSNDNSGAFYQTNSHIRIGLDTWASSDVVMHEFGHHIAENANLDSDTNWGDDHSFGRDNIGANDGGRDYGATKGSHLAYGEAVATFLAMMAIDDGNYAADTPGLPARDTDAVYHDLDSDKNGNLNTIESGELTHQISIESATPALGAASSRGRGEGDELSVVRAMWDFYDPTGENLTFAAAITPDTDDVDFSPAQMWSNMSGADTFSDLWENIAADAIADPALVGLPAAAKPAHVLTTLGEILEDHRIAAHPLTKGNLFDLTPDLVMQEDNNNNSHNYIFVLFDTNWNTVFSYDFANSDPELNATKLKNLGVTNVPGLTQGDSYYFAVLNSPAIDAATLGVNEGSWSQYYWSGANLITIIPEPTTLALLTLTALTLRLRRSPRAITESTR